MADIDEGGSQEAAQRIEENGGTAVARAVDVTDETSCESLVDFAVRNMGPLDVGVVAAGISHGLYRSREPRMREIKSSRDDALLINKPTDYWRRVLSVNLDGMFYTDRALGRHFVNVSRPGAIVNSEPPLPT